MPGCIRHSRRSLCALLLTLTAFNAGEAASLNSATAVSATDNTTMSSTGTSAAAASITAAVKSSVGTPSSSSSTGTSALLILIAIPAFVVLGTIVKRVLKYKAAARKATLASKNSGVSNVYYIQAGPVPINTQYPPNPEWTPADLAPRPHDGMNLAAVTKPESVYSYDKKGYQASLYSTPESAASLPYHHRQQHLTESPKLSGKHWWWP